MSKVIVSKSDILLWLNLLVYCVRYFSDIPIAYGMILIGAMGTINYIYCFYKCKNLRKSILCLVLLCVISIFNASINDNNGVHFAIYICAIQSMGVLFFVNRDSMKSLGTVALIIFWYIILQVLLDLLLGNDIAISFLVGKNTISIMLIFMLGLYIIYCHKTGKVLNLWLFMVALIIAVLCGGIGGILSVSCFLVGMLMCNRKDLKLSPIKVVIIVGFAFLIFIFNETLIFDILSEDNSRFWLWEHYGELAFKSYENLFFGANVYSNRILYTWANTHNTFLNFHYLYGLIPMVVYIYIVLSTTIYMVRSKQYVFAILMAITILRAFTDSADFAFMPIWIYFYLVKMSGNREKQILVKE